MNPSQFDVKAHMKSKIKRASLIALAVSAGVFTLGCNSDNKSTQASNSSGVAIENNALTSANQADVDQIAKTLEVSYRLVTSIPSDKCDPDIEGGKCFEVELTFTAPEAITANNWQIFFSQIAPIQSSESDEFSITHINGDLHRIDLKPEYRGFAKGESKSILFRAMFWSLAESDAMPNYLITADNITAQVIESTKEKIDPDTGLEYSPFVVSYSDLERHFKRSANDKTVWLTPEVLFERNQTMPQALRDVSTNIIPTPLQADFKAGAKPLSLTSGIAVDFGNVDKTLVTPALARLAKFGIAASEQGIPLSLAVNADASKKLGSYQLSITESGIKVVGSDVSGVANGLQSLASLVKLGESTVPQAQIIDEPLFEFRGILVDVARNFHSKDFILRLLDQMAANKLNKLHLHLGDDEGWRLEIPSLPELTEVGAKRCFDVQEQNCLMPQLGAGIDSTTPVNGFYSVADYQEILRAASARHIQVIPSLDMPGHSRASVVAMQARYNRFMALEDKEKAEQFLLHDPLDTTKYSSVQFYNDNTINVCLESSFDFIREVMQQVKAIHAEAGQPLTRYHIGADETAGAWVESPACISFLANNTYGVTTAKELPPYFVERVSGILAELGIEAAAWSDGLEHTNKDKMPAVVQANAWGHLPWDGHKQAHELANRNWQVVVSTPDALYFDFPYEAHPKEHGYYWASRQTNTEKIFQFMPENLPAHAEFWLDREDNTFAADDTVIKGENGNVVSTPLTEGRKFLGIQAQLWSENTRSDEMAEHKIYPRLFALAERAWHQASWAVPYNYQGFSYSSETKKFSEQKRQARDLQWQQFAHVIGQKALPKLELEQVTYRLPTVGAKIVDGKLQANIAFPGIAIEYREKGKKWTVYQGEVAVSAPVEVRSVSFDGKRKSRTSIVSNAE